MSFPTGTTNHPLNNSKKQKRLVSIWDFGAISPKKERAHYRFNDHPAKMRPSLARAILQIYGEPPVLDPMCGIGTTCIEASLLGMESVGIEYEKKFVDQARENVQHIRKIYPDKKLGKAKIIQGDARSLTKIFKQNAGSIIFSPPYAGSLSAKKNTKSLMSKGERIRWANGEQIEKRGMNYGTNPSNIGNVANYGIFNSIVFSPPYSEGIGHVAGKNASEKYPWRLKLQRKMTETWSEGNIAKLKHGDNLFNSIIFSPPYGEATRGGGIAKRGYKGIHGIDKSLKDRIDRPVSNDRNNISNTLYGQSYLGEMFRVYSECYDVLRPGKFMVVVVKDIRRKGLTILVGADTIALCKLAGFELFDVLINKLYFPSFWQINQAIKDRENGVVHPLKVHEYVLVFRKSN